MTELEMLRHLVAGVPIHQHDSPKRGKWHCKSPYCTSLQDEGPRAAPGEPSEHGQIFDLGDFDA